MSSEAITKNDLIAILNQVLPVVPAEYIIGEIKPYAGVTVPDGWLECDGSEVLITDYPLLYAAIGGTWGAASDNDHFVLPNLKGKVLVGQDTGDTSFDVVGETGGSKYIQQHSHSATYTRPSTSSGGSWALACTALGSRTGSTTLLAASANCTASASGGTRYRIGNNSYTGSAVTNLVDKITHSGHTHTMTGGGVSVGNINTSGLSTGSAGNLQPYAVVKYIICATVGSSGSGGGGGPIDASSIPSTDKVAKFDSDAFMNSSDMDATELSDFLSGLNVGGGSTGDFVVEQGNSGNWAYRKWNSGLLECWLYASVGTLEFNNSTYRAYLNYTYDTSPPIPFVSVYSLSGNARSNTLAIHFSNMGYDTSSQKVYGYLLADTSDTSSGTRSMAGCYVTATVVGTWK